VGSVGVGTGGTLGGGTWGVIGSDGTGALVGVPKVGSIASGVCRASDCCRAAGVCRAAGWRSFDLDCVRAYSAALFGSLLPGGVGPVEVTLRTF
jgi:hypothetical protein